MNDFNRHLGKKIKTVRESINLSQEKLAEMLAIPRAAVSQIENGRRELKSVELIEIAKVFNCSVDELLDLKKEPGIIVTGDEASSEVHEIRINVPRKNLAKFKEVLLYILNKVGSKPNIGETVLYKLLYFIDFDFYEKYEEQLMGASYIKNHFGPTPLEFKKIVQEMIKDKELIKIDDRYFKYPQTKYLPLREPDLKYLKASEIEMINDVLNRLSRMNASQISKYSHHDVPWLTAENQAVIEYESVFYRTPPYSVRSNSNDDV
ncbi:MAG: type II toxin-antitoxin system antitoxin SocA domain-containing protein [Candidatus Omnitrophota bacterium]